jgi:hypothetical protein
MDDGMSNMNRTIESTKNDLSNSVDEARSVVSSAASKIADTARVIPGKVYDAVKPAGRYAREHKLVVGIALGALAALGITIFMFSRRD